MEYLKKRELSEETIRNSVLAVPPGIRSPVSIPEGQGYSDELLKESGTVQCR